MKLLYSVIASFYGHTIYLYTKFKRKSFAGIARVTMVAIIYKFTKLLGKKCIY